MKGLKLSKGSIKGLGNAVMAAAVKHYPEILIGVGVTGMIGAIGTSILATRKADIKIAKQEKELNRKLTKTETLQEIWTEYIPPVVMAAASTACILGANKAHEKRNAALAAAYVLSETQAVDLKNKVEEILGEKTAKEIQHEINKDTVESTPPTTQSIIVTEKGNTLCLDKISGRYFRSDIETIRRAINALNQRLMSEMYISANEFYYKIGLEPATVGDMLGWNIDNGMIDVWFDAQLTSDGVPCLVLDFVVQPRYDYRRLL